MLSKLLKNKILIIFKSYNFCFFQPINIVRSTAVCTKVNFLIPCSFFGELFLIFTFKWKIIQARDILNPFWVQKYRNFRRFCKQSFKSNKKNLSSIIQMMGPKSFPNFPEGKLWTNWYICEFSTRFIYETSSFTYLDD